MARQIITGITEKEGARYALICGDPERVPKIASKLSSAKNIMRVREYNIMAGTLEGEKAVVASTGIGGPSTAILMEELANTGTDTFIRVGTSGGIANGLTKGDLVITTGAYRKDGTSRSYVPDTFPALAHTDIISALTAAAKKLGLRYQSGLTLSVDGFYSENKIIDKGIIKSMSHLGFALSGTENSLGDAKKLGVKNIEMEMGTVLTLTTLWGIRGGGVCLVSDVAPWHYTEDVIDPETGMENCIAVGIEATRNIIRSDRK
ncbi:MAG: nucleoside phosphorylase [Candidatus Thermoplasmatota archaeon]|jgi:uridine phosphorylase|nr:nucleoside phosphorylase [Candidatus Sysuiplasma jiujiangense]MBX8638812.1 nucleoside phosphorylase [Candidatus Sysuiplasma jiujiangense]MBX8641096.1 nucleoside phosphorylase [Candidatus Sysuiplasma jiujiangense]MCL4317944.1 nucleoside phosphorylase [Candidatus Thermoplasmatota archaeon]MCL5253198.1 nucleoside phosphorylase [Candidatus Thermoplasmatota archaeon]